MVAIGLARKKELWKTKLQGLGAIKHFKYSNRVTLQLGGTIAVIRGKESAGKYIELVDLETGKTLANRRFD